MAMTLEDYVIKYGMESGTKRYHGVQRLLASRKATWDSYPYPRLTEPWFVWKYGNEDGSRRYADHVNKSKHTLDNFVRIHGSEIGPEKYKAAISKKDTKSIVLLNQGQEAVDDWYNRAKAKAKNTRLEWSDDKKTQIRTKMSETKRRNRRGRTNLQIYVDRHGAHDGPVKYAEHLTKLFKQIGTSKQAEQFIQNVIKENQWLRQYTLFYRSSLEPEMNEWFLADADTIRFYDFTVKEMKVILEYDGAMWHPTTKQAIENANDIMPVTGLTFEQAYVRDCNKRRYAEQDGYAVFVVRSDDPEEQKAATVDSFIQEVKKRAQ